MPNFYYVINKYQSTPLLDTIVIERIITLFNSFYIYDSLFCVMWNENNIEI